MTELIKDIRLTLDKIAKIEEEYAAKKTACEKYIDLLKSKMLPSLGLSEGDAVTLEIHEYREDKVHCFAVAQTVECFIKDVQLHMPNKYDTELYLKPLLLKTKKAKRTFGNYIHSWTLKKDGKVILEHVKKSDIIPGTYKEEELEAYRTRLYESQKIK